MHLFRISSWLILLLSAAITVLKGWPIKISPNFKIHHGWKGRCFYWELIAKLGGKDPESGRAEVSIPAGPWRLRNILRTGLRKHRVSHSEQEAVGSARGLFTPQLYPSCSLLAWSPGQLQVPLKGLELNKMTNYRWRSININWHWSD